MFGVISSYKFVIQWWRGLITRVGELWCWDIELAPTVGLGGANYWPVRSKPRVGPWGLGESLGLTALIEEGNASGWPHREQRELPALGSGRIRGRCTPSPQLPEGPALFVIFSIMRHQYLIVRSTFLLR